MVAVLAEHFITAPLTGCIRGLTHHGAHVETGTKVVEIDPRSDPSTCFGLGSAPGDCAGRPEGRGKMKRSELHEIAVRRRGDPDVKALLMEIKRLHGVLVQAHELTRPIYHALPDLTARETVLLTDRSS